MNVVVIQVQSSRIYIFSFTICFSWDQKIKNENQNFDNWFKNGNQNFDNWIENFTYQNEQLKVQTKSKQQFEENSPVMCRLEIISRKDPGGGGLSTPFGNCCGWAARNTNPIHGESWKKNIHHRCRICEKPIHSGQEMGHFERKLPFCTPSEGRIFKSTHRGAGMLKKAPVIGANHLLMPEVCEWSPRSPEMWG